MARTNRRLYPYQASQPNALLKAKEADWNPAQVVVVVRDTVGQNERVENYEAVFSQVQKAVDRRREYRIMFGRPCPTDLTNAREIAAVLEHMKPVIKRRINQELATQALGAIQAVAKTYVDSITNPQVTSLDMPQTPGEVLLQQVEQVQHDVLTDASEQAYRRKWLTQHVICGEWCPYPEQCCCDGTGEDRHFRILRGEWRCLLDVLSLYVQAQGVKKLIGQRFEPAVLPNVLKKIRASFYYHQSQESCLSCIRRPSLNRWHKGCTVSAGRGCLLKLQEQQWLARAPEEQVVDSHRLGGTDKTS